MQLQKVLAEKTKDLKKVIGHYAFAQVAHVLLLYVGVQTTLCWFPEYQRWLKQSVGLARGSVGRTVFELAYVVLFFAVLLPGLSKIVVSSMAAL